MKFFSNDAARDTGGAPIQDEDRDRTDEIAAVPQQRAGSPWSDAPGESRPDASPDSSQDISSDAELADQERRDGTEETGRYDVDESRDRDDFDPDRTEVVRDDAEADRTVVINHGDDTTDRMGDAPAAGTRDDSPVDLALDDDRDRATATTYGPDGTVNSTDEPALRDEGTFDSPTVVEPATGEPVTSADSSADAGSDSSPASAPETAREETSEPVVAPVPVTPAPAAASSSSPTSASATDGDRFFPDGDGLADRFRDIQLRFVDSPKEATAEAAGLVDEALDKLTAALKGRRESMASNSEDTEQLRVELRGYRELLNRVLGL
jgi:hypothetical protein